MRRLIALALLFSPSVAHASIPDAAGVIHGCFQPQAGLVRIIDSSTTGCHRGEVPIAWNQTGVAGPMGPTGPIGLTGPTGQTGAIGPQGVPGESVIGESLALSDDNCPYGGSRFTLAGAVTYACNGAPGATGPQGATGSPGATGPQGPAGPRGATGPQGPAGPPGPPGSITAPLGLVPPLGALSGSGVEGFMSIAGIEGPSVRPGFAGAFELSHFGLSVTAHPSGPPSWTLRVATPLGIGLPQVFSAAATGAVLRDVTFSLRRMELHSLAPTFLEVELTDATVKQVETSAVAVGVTASTGVILAFDFRRIRIAYTPELLDEEDVLVSWDLATGIGSGASPSSFDCSVNGRPRPGVEQLSYFAPAAQSGAGEFGDATLGSNIRAFVVKDMLFAAKRSVLPDGEVRVFSAGESLDKDIELARFGFDAPVIHAVSIAGPWATVSFGASGYEWTTFGYKPDGTPLPADTSAYP